MTIPPRLAATLCALCDFSRAAEVPNIPISRADDLVKELKALLEQSKASGRSRGEPASCKKGALRYPPSTMPALVIESFPEELHAKLRRIAAAHSRSVTQETIHLLETAIAEEEKTPPAASSVPSVSYWANRNLLPEYEAALKSGALTSDSDSAIGLSEERDAR